MKKENKTEVIIYRGKSGGVEVSVDLQNETFLLTQQQVAEIFDVQKAAISKHVKNIFETGELSEKATVSILETVQKEGNRTISRKIEYYNLDLVLSVGYRINSVKATQFRIWATSILKNYLLKGYAVNESRLLEAKGRFNELKETIAFLKEKSSADTLKGQEKEIIDLLATYANTLTILEKYDSGELKEVKGGKPEYVLTLEDARNTVKEVKKNLMTKKEAGDLFGNEREDMFEAVIKNLYQTFGGKELYNGLATKASHLLYFIIKDHSFSDGNKRLGAFLFVHYLNRNKALYRESGEKKINDNGLAALALLIAESRPEEKDQMVALVSQLLKQ